MRRERDLSVSRSRRVSSPLSSSLDEVLVLESSFQTWGLGSRFAAVPLSGGQTAWFATVAFPDHHPLSSTSGGGGGGGVFGEDNEGGLAFLRGRFAEWHDPIPSLLDRTPPEAILFEHARALPSRMEGGAAGRKLGPTCSRSNHHYPRVALVGDAAHAIDPVLAQGTGVAIEDAAQLAASIARIQQDPSSSSYTAAAVGAAVASYEESRAGRVRVLAAVSDLSQFFGQIGTTTTPSLSPPMPSDGGGGGAGDSRGASTGSSELLTGLDPERARRLQILTGLKTPRQGAQTSIWAATAPQISAARFGGRFLREVGLAEAEARRIAPGYGDDELGRELWRKAEALSGAPFNPSPIL